MKKTLLTTICSFALFFGSNAQLIAHYPLTNGLGNDVSGNNLNASTVAISDTTDHLGNPGRAGFLPGYQYSGLSVAHNSLLNFTDHISIAAWIKPVDLMAQQKIVDKDAGSTTGNFMLDIYNGKLRFWVASGHVEEAVQSMLVDHWYHVVATYNGVEADIYVNGILVASNSVTGTLDVNTSPMQIGFDQNGWEPFWGSMSDVRVYGNTLSSIDVINLYGSQVPVYGMVSKWSFNFGNAIDEIGTDNGTPTGVTLTTDRFGNPGRAYAFDGLDDQVYFVGSDFGTNDFSISMWVKTDAAANGKVLCKVSPGATGGVSIETLSSNPDFYEFWNYLGGNTGTNRIIQTVEHLDTANWYHLVLNNRFADSTSVYINGVLSHSITTPMAGTIGDGSPIYLGTNGQGGFGFKGKIDDIYVYDRALSDAEITALYNDPNPNPNSTAGITELDNQTVLSVYPNPAKTILNVDISNLSQEVVNTEIKIINLLGEVVLTRILNGENNSIDVSGLEQGVYFIHSGKTAMKFIKG